MKPLTKPLLLCLALTTALPLAAQDVSTKAVDPSASAPTAPEAKLKPEPQTDGPRASILTDPSASDPATPEPKLKPEKPEPKVGKDPFTKSAIDPTEAKPKQSVAGTTSYGKVAEVSPVPVKKHAYQSAAVVTEVAAPVPQEALLRLEMFSLQPNAARRALIGFPAAADLYAWAGQQSEKEEKDGVALERVDVIRAKSGQRSLMGSSAEFPYATEFSASPAGANAGVNEPKAAPVHQAPGTGAGALSSETPAGSTVGGNAPSAADTLPKNRAANAAGNGAPDPGPTRIIPKSIEFRTIGLNVEAQVELNEDGRTAYIEIAPERVRLLKEITYDAQGEIRQPVFETQKFVTQCTARAGVPLFLGTFNPPARTGVPGGADEGRTWFCFLTMTIPE